MPFQQILNAFKLRSCLLVASSACSITIFLVQVYPAFVLNQTLLTFLHAPEQWDSNAMPENPWIGHNPRLLWLLGERTLAATDDNFDQALTYWQIAPTTSAAMLASQARITYRAGKRQTAIALAQLSLTLDKNQPDVTQFTATTLSELEEWSEATVYWATAAEFAPDDADVQTNYGWALYQAGKTTEAKRPLEKALALSPEDWEVNENYLRFLETDGSREEYREQLLRIRNLYPEAIIIQRRIAELALEEGRYTDAIQGLTAVLAERPTWDEVAATLGDIYLVLGDIDQAHSMYSYALKLSPRQLRYHLGLINTFEGDERAVHQYVCQLSKIEPTLYERVREALALRDLTCSPE